MWKITLRNSLNVLLIKHQVAKLKNPSSKNSGPSPPVGMITSRISVSDKPYSVEAKMAPILLAAHSPTNSSNVSKMFSFSCKFEFESWSSIKISLLRNLSFCIGVSRNTSGGRAVVTIKCTPNNEQKNHIVIFISINIILM